MSKISIKFDDEGGIVNLYGGERAGGWTTIDSSKFPSGGEAIWAPGDGGEGLAWRMFYRPGTPNDTPPDRFNDDPGPSGWHPKSTDTIGVVFEKIENDDIL